jgi:hypothetical protein
MLNKKELIKLRRQIVLNSIYTNDYHNDLDLYPPTVQSFFDGYIEFLDEDDLKESDDNLWHYYHMFDEDPLPRINTINESMGIENLYRLTVASTNSFTCNWGRYPADEVFYVYANTMLQAIDYMSDYVEDNHLEHLYQPFSYFEERAKEEDVDPVQLAEDEGYVCYGSNGIYIILTDITKVQEAKDSCV